MNEHYGVKLVHGGHFGDWSWQSMMGEGGFVSRRRALLGWLETMCGMTSEERAVLKHLNVEFDPVADALERALPYCRELKRFHDGKYAVTGCAVAYTKREALMIYWREQSCDSGSGSSSASTAGGGASSS